MLVITTIFFINLSIEFIVIYFAIKIAINPLLIKKEENNSKKNSEPDLIMLRDLEILSDVELEETIELCQSKNAKKEEYKQYDKYAKILNELKEFEYFTEEQYTNKKNQLKKHFNLN